MAEIDVAALPMRRKMRAARAPARCSGADADSSDRRLVLGRLDPGPHPATLAESRRLWPTTRSCGFSFDRRGSQARTGDAGTASAHGSH